MELSEIGIFNNLDNIQMLKLVEKVFEVRPVEEEYSSIKALAIKKAIELNEKADKASLVKDNKVKNEGLILLNLYEKAIKGKEHPYEVLKKNGYIKAPVDEFLKIN